ncbi:cupin domain-containing protein [Alkalibacterium sp. s-m-22]
MVETHRFKEQSPFPNHPLPVIIYPKAVEEVIQDYSNPAEAVKSFFSNNGYTNGWENGIYDFHHFHSNTHEVLGCASGRATVQLGGPHSNEFTVEAGDVMLLPAGVAHKLLTSTNDFKVVGAYPNGESPDLQRGDAVDYERVKQRCYDIPVPETDPVSGESGAVQKYWALSTDE